MAEEVMNIQEMEVEDNTKILVALIRNSDGIKIALTDEQYEALNNKGDYSLEGIVVRNEDNGVDLLFYSGETLGVFGVGPSDIPENDMRRKNAPASPSFYELDGQRRTKWQSDNHPDTHESGCAICEALKFGWLPSNGEIGWALERVEKFNEVANVCGAQPLKGTMYWCSTQYDPDYMWCKNMESGNFEFWHSKTTQMSIRPVKSASGYAEVVE